MRWFVISTLLVSLLSIPASALDCSSAKTSIERAICGTSELSNADAAMAKAYSTLKSALPGDQQSLLLADQRRWLRDRDTTCGEKKDREFLTCVLAETERRGWFLAGEGPNRATGAPRLQPAFFQETKKGRYEINALYPHIVTPSSPAEKALNKAARKLVLDSKALGEIRDWKPAPGAPGISSYDATYGLTYLDPRLAGTVFTFSTYGVGAAHPNTGRESLVFDFSRGRPVTLADVVSAPADAVPAISELCKNQLKAQAAKGWLGAVRRRRFCCGRSRVCALGPQQRRRRYSVRSILDRSLRVRSARVPAFMGRSGVVAETGRPAAAARASEQPYDTLTTVPGCISIRSHTGRSDVAPVPDRQHRKV
jgi:uncharacterized protein YecT (DUF1311 family)